ncbi:hypothetical protein RI129_011122 [Pyrocoelia pectoralis]|uniref:AMP-dependent synthetase/ligase domain-containing protein n=1 Tax=Pyrocoelia pectoralis TaxID=417401 RepID=A0AAN7ZH80_9COLE
MEFRNNIISHPQVKFPYSKGIGSILYEKMLEAQSAIAQIDDHSGQIDTYQTLLERCIRTAKGMRSSNVSAGDVTVIHSHNHINAVVPLIASYFLGAIPAIIDYGLPLNSTIQLLAKVLPRIAFTNASGVDKLSTATRKLGLTTEVVNFDKFTNFISPFTSDDFAPIDIKNLDQPAAIFFTSGTTGVPKKICLSHKLLLSSIINLQ